MEHAEALWQDKDGDVEGYPYTGSPKCVDGVVNMTEVDFETDEQSDQLLRSYKLSVNAQS